jgi:hypothetical protein
MGRKQLTSTRLLTAANASTHLAPLRGMSIKVSTKCESNGKAHRWRIARVCFIFGYSTMPRASSEQNKGLAVRALQNL